MKLGNSFTRVLSRFYQFPEPFLDRRKVKLFSYFISTPFDYLLTLGRTHKVIPPPWYRGGWWGRGVWSVEPLPWVFDMLKYTSISKKLCFHRKGFDLLNKINYILWVVSLLRTCDVTKHGSHLGRHLGFYQELEIRLKPRELVIFWAWHVK